MTTQKNVGWVRPEAVTHQTEQGDGASLCQATGWPMARVGEICGSVNGRAFKPTEWTDKGIPIIRIQNLKNSDAPFNYFAGALEDKFKVKTGDLLFAWSGTPGTSFGAHIWHGPDAALNQHIFNLHFDRTRVDAKYFCYALNRNVADYVAKAQGGVGLAHITKGKFENSEIPLPPLDQQKCIVAEIEKQFSRLDEAVANLKRVKANLKRYKAAVLKAAVEGRLVETEAELARKKTPSPLAGEGGGEGASYETGAQLLQRILETRRSLWLARADKAGGKGKGKYKEPAAPDTTDLPELPEGWVWVSIGSLGDVIGGLTKNPKRAKLKRKLPYLRVANVYANELRLDEVEEIGVEDGELEKLLVQKGDLLIVEGNGSPDQIGRLAIWDGSISPCVHQNHLIKVRLHEECAPQWVVSWLMSPDGRNRVRDVASSTSGLYTLSVGKVSNLPVPLPPNSEQLRIIAEVDRRLSLIRETEAQIDSNNKRSERLRQSILSQSFAGRLPSGVTATSETRPPLPSVMRQV